MNGSQNRSVKVDCISELAPFFELLRRYYAGTFARGSERKSLPLFKEEPFAWHDERVAEALNVLADVSAGDIRRFDVEFNRLFVGPGKLPAPPYEMVYMSAGRLLQHPSLPLPECYRRANLEPHILRAHPDDHLSLELACAMRLAWSKRTQDLDLLADFLLTHLGVWYKDHIRDIRSATTNTQCLAAAQMLESVLDAGVAWAHEHEQDAAKGAA